MDRKEEFAHFKILQIGTKSETRKKNEFKSTDRSHSFASKLTDCIIYSLASERKKNHNS